MQRQFQTGRSVTLWLTLLAVLALQNAARAVSLQDFGYQHMNVNGQLALGQRPLLLIVASFAGETYPDGSPAPLLHDASFYDNEVFNGAQYPSLNGYFSNMSNGRFSWTRAGLVTLSLPASQQDKNWPGPGGDGPGEHDRPYMSNLVYQAMASGQFNFKAFDANGDGHVTQDELGIVVIGNDFTGCRVVGAPIVSPDGTYDWGGQGSTAIGTFRDVDSPFITLNEEFEETLGPPDIYGQNCWSLGLSPQSCEPDYTTQYYNLYYLDPWNRMSLGWCSPRFVSMAAGGLITISCAQAGDPTSPVILYDPAHGTNEYWILEYRTQMSPYGGGYDANADNYAAADTSSNGLAIWHIQQDPNHNLLTTVSNSITTGQQLTDWTEGQPQLQPGSSVLWGSDSVTPTLKWWNGDLSGMSMTSSATHLHVKPFSLGAGSITLECITVSDVWVDFNFTGSPQTGTFDNPYSTMVAGVSGASYGGNLHLKTGTSPESLTITKPMNIVGYNGPATVGL